MSDLLNRSDIENTAWDSLQRVSVLSSSDKKLKIFTWNVLFENLTHQCFGFIWYKPDDNYYLYQLSDFYRENDTLNHKFRSHLEWYGAVYYSIIERPVGRKQKLYTLLGWRGKNALTQQKIIETLEFDRNNLPVFGKSRIRVQRKKTDRIIFTYAINAQMLLRFNKKQNLIVADHLAPSNSKLEGHYEYYGPDFSYDAFEYSKGKWILKPNIDAEIAINFKRNSKINQLKKRKPSTDF